jgi:hypothetical protein
MNIPATLATASLYRANALKEVCFEYIYVRGKDLLLNDPAFEEMPQHLLLELLRDYATRRSVRTQFVIAAEAPPAAAPVAETAGSKKRKTA